MKKSERIPSTARCDAAAVTQLALAVFRANGALIQWGDRLVGPLGLTSARWQMLGAIALAGQPLSAPQVGDAMGVSRQGAQKQLNVLADLCLVEAVSNPAHKRSPLYRLTARGQRLYCQADGLWTQCADQMAAHFNARDAKAAIETLTRMLELIEPPSTEATR
ncbi:MarR family winged helix-turn-helix transcriptional regulator [Luteimonas sp. 3794]|uniref:MarR family winged helix-turn-helix transcriptional regulator n=1 Tax=Luteimonas sp. 3794 TaxID=2817730 RepID=UPI00285A9FB9|nr:MarR family winged helix-turn-helix transcriptional regulator [Luteimonas sp. 3794]MDR6990289.1 DNA-binding MarR family transcriptional regulator [Luteimonas sp. 3794]